ncbi:MAG: tetratricopeptide repeat protein, partial [Planctomycetes bacterium]|nr:tetratricopeptide repeat protein [Planctomycetota bacterium]
ELLEERRFYEAVEAFSDLVALSPDLTGAYGNRGIAYLNLGLEDKARSDFETVLHLDPDDAMSHSMLAEIARFRGEWPDALRHVNAALELAPDEPQAYFVRGWLFAKAGQFVEASDDLDRYLELTGDGDASLMIEFISACRMLAADEPVDDDGEAITSREAVERYLGQWGWSFDMTANTDYQADGLPCAFAHCIRNRPPLIPEAEGCPVFGHSCPGGSDQVAWCRDHPPLLD